MLETIDPLKITIALSDSFKNEPIIPPKEKGIETEDKAKAPGMASLFPLLDKFNIATKARGNIKYPKIRYTIPSPLLLAK